MTEPIRVSDNQAERRYEAWVGDDLAGFLTYRLGPGRIVLVHTETEDGWHGHGVGGRLAASALDDARGRGLRVTPLCPFVADYISRHPEYDDLVHPSDD
ncbi:MAG TPA: GNAT family N-acetyltransferase [Acidimicrobiia bacterium]